MQDYLFGDLLKTLRKAKHLSQQALADKLGVHRNTIWGWEQGVYLPDSKGMVLELARQLDLDERETRQLLEASLTTVAAYWNVPFARNPFFTGREQVLHQLQAALSQQTSSAALTQSYALHGLGGIGKTQVAVEYAYEHRAEYEAVLWVEAETPTTLVSSFVALAELLSLPERVEEKDQNKLVAAVLRWLNRHKGWLLVFDNVEDAAQLKPFLPTSGQGSLLFTTRLHTLGTLAQPVELAPMTMDEGVHFLLVRTKRHPANQARDSVDPHERTAARELVAAMGALPLALDQAGAYIVSTQGSLADYLQLFKLSQLRLLDAHDAASDHPLSVSQTFALTFDLLEQHHSAAADLLTVCAFLAPDGIPESLFLDGAVQLGPTFEALAADPLAFQDALKALLTYSLIQRDPAAHTLTIHRLVQVVLKERLREDVQRAWVRRVIEALSQLFPVDEITRANYWQTGERLLSHAQVVLASGQRREGNELLSLALRNHVATYLRKRAQYAEAEAHFAQSIRVGEAALSTEHPLVAEALHGQAEVYREQARHAEAEPLYQRALRIREQETGPEHPDVAHTLTGLAILYHQRNKYAEAEPLYWRALRIWERELGPRHPQVAYVFHCLANLSHDQGKYFEAELRHRRALQIWEQELGPEHPRVASSLHGLANLYGDQGKYAEAEPLYRRALQIWEQALGPQHPDVAYPLKNLANLYREQGRYAEAEPFAVRALQIWEQVLGPQHPNAALPLNTLANIYHEQGKYSEAEPLYQRALRIWEQTFGPQHINVASALNNLAELYYKQGKYSEAEPLYQRALSIIEQLVGPVHLYVAHTLHGLANLYSVQEKYEQAASLYQRVLAIRQQRLISDHPDLAETLHDLAHFHQMQQHTEEARSLYQQALTIRERALGAHHPKTEETRSAFMQLLREISASIEDTDKIEQNCPKTT